MVYAICFFVRGEFVSRAGGRDAAKSKAKDSKDMVPTEKQSGQRFLRASCRAWEIPYWIRTQANRGDSEPQAAA